MQDPGANNPPGLRSQHASPARSAAGACFAKVLHNSDVVQQQGADGVEPPIGARTSADEQGADPDGPAMPGSSSIAGQLDGQPSLGVMGAASVLGIAPATLRSWDRRYAMAPSLHTRGGHRRYSPRDMARLQAMGRMVRSGVPPAEAARACLALPDEALLPATTATQEPGTGAGDAPRTATGAQVLAMPAGLSGPAASRGLARAAAALDATTCLDILRRSLAASGAQATWEELARPVLHGIGARWEANGVGVEVEHAFSAAVTLAFASHAHAAATRTTVAGAAGQIVMLASAPDELHDIPMVVLHAALAERGVTCLHLGARTPTRALADAVARVRPAVLVLWAQDPQLAHVPELPHRRPAAELVLAGPAWPDPDDGPAPARDLPGAIQAVAQALHVDLPQDPAPAHLAALAREYVAQPGAASPRRIR